MPYYRIVMRQTNVCRKVIIVEACEESEARRVAFKQSGDEGFSLDTSERRRRYIEKITKLVPSDLEEMERAP